MLADRGPWPAQALPDPRTSWTVGWANVLTPERACPHSPTLEARLRDLFDPFAFAESFEPAGRDRVDAMTAAEQRTSDGGVRVRVGSESRAHSLGEPISDVCRKFDGKEVRRTA